MNMHIRLPKDHTQPPAGMHVYQPQPRASVAMLIAQWWARGWRTYWHRRAQRATLMLLASLDERTLRDIGIAPSEIASAVYGSPDRVRSYAPSCPVAARETGRGR